MNPWQPPGEAPWQQVRWSLSVPFQNVSENLIPAATEMYLGRTDDLVEKKSLFLDLMADVMFGVPSVIVARCHRGESGERSKTMNSPDRPLASAFHHKKIWNLLRVRSWRPVPYGLWGFVLLLPVSVWEKKVHMQFNLRGDASKHSREMRKWLGDQPDKWPPEPHGLYF